ncbi:MAG: T9SS type A sorting domain-containing protein [Flavobacteriales bacterium]|nr:T9SS type A sorting domain-containing protein [Flavobacteriales bacterium]
MKRILYSFILLFSVSAVFAQANLYEQLLEVNAEWQHRPVAQELYEAQAPEQLNDREAIARHLEAIQGFLLTHRPVGLNPQQLERREALLETLTPYYTEDWFPVNDVLPMRRPIFIDQYDHFCAVGYLMKESGYESLARRISEEMNYAYVREMEWPEIGEWAEWAGFTPEELAWIQPPYPPTGYFISSLGQGTNGNVLAIEETDAGGVMVGGSFTQVDGSISANYIAEWRPGFAGFHWVDLQCPLNSPVKDILRVGTTYYVAGDFSMHGNSSSVYMYSENNGWEPFGQLNGQVEQLIEYQDTLYAVGLFGWSPLGISYGVAVWIGNGWMMIGGVHGKVNAAVEFNDELYIGVDFNDAGSHVKKYDGIQFSIPGNTPIAAPVNDFAVYGGQLYAAGDFFDPYTADTFGIARWSNGDWENLFWATNFVAEGNDSSFYELEVFHDHLVLGGSFNYNPIVGILGRNLAVFNDDFDSFSGLSLVNEPVYALKETFNTSLYFGGEFTMANSSNINHIGVSDFGLVGIDENERVQLTLYPNPTAESLRIDWPEAIRSAEVLIRDIQGKVVMRTKLDRDQTLSVANLASGSYTLEFRSDNGGWNGTFVKR